MLFIVMTVAAVLSCWAVYQLKWIHQRRQAVDWFAASDRCWYAPSLVAARNQASAPWSLRVFGEQGVVGVGIDREQFAAGNIPYRLSDLQCLFPEARVDWSRDGRYEDEP